MSANADQRISITSADGTSLALWHFGGTGPALLFVHATGFCAQVWAPMADLLRDRFDCYSLDVRGHGASEPQPVDQSWDRVAEDVSAAVAAIGRPVFGVGHSMGGAALVLANADAGERSPLTGLWLFEPIIFPPEFRDMPSDANPLVAGALKRRATFASAAEAVANYSAKPPFATLAPDCLEAYVTHGFEPAEIGITLRCRPEVEAGFYRGGARHHGWEACAEIDIPVAFVAGAVPENGPAPASLAPLLAQRTPGAVFVEMQELGHFGPLESPQRCASSVAEFTAVASD